MRGFLLMVRASTVAFLSLLAGACTGGQEASPPVSTPGTQSGAAPDASAPTATAAPNRCPLTAEQVSSALGTQLKGPDSTGSFESVDGKLRPHVLFVRQVRFACSGTMPAENGLKEQVPGLGTTAYIADETNGTRVLVCQGTTPFEITVDAETRERQRDGAIALARQVLAGS